MFDFYLKITDATLTNLVVNENMLIKQSMNPAFTN